MKPTIGKAQVDFSEQGPVPEGVYECVIKQYKEVDNPFYRGEPYTSDKVVTKGNKSYQPGEVIPADPDWVATQFQWVFEIVDGPHAGRWLFKRTGTQLTANERNHLYKLFSKVLDPDDLGARIADGDAPDMDDEIVGSPIKVTTEVVSTKKGQSNKVTGFMRSDRVLVDEAGGVEIGTEDIPF